MNDLLSSVGRVQALLNRRPQLAKSYELRLESIKLLKALDIFLAKALDLELTFSSVYAETASLLEGEAKAIATRDFMRTFSRKHCSKTINPKRVNKKIRKAFLIQVARDNKLHLLRNALQPKKKYIELLQDLLDVPEKAIQRRVLAMKANDIASLAKANGLHTLKTKTGRVSGSKKSKAYIIKQIIEIKRSDESLDSLVDGQRL